MGLGCTDGPSLTTLGFKRKRQKLLLRSYRPRFAVGTSVSYSRLLGGNRLLVLILEESLQIGTVKSQALKVYCSSSSEDPKHIQDERISWANGFGREINDV